MKFNFTCLLKSKQIANLTFLENTLILSVNKLTKYTIK